MRRPWWRFHPRAETSFRATVRVNEGISGTTANSIVRAPSSRIMLCTQKKQALRAPWIVEFLNEQDYDIVVLQEVIDHKMTASEGAAELGRIYPVPLANGFLYARPGANLVSDTGLHRA